MESKSVTTIDPEIISNLILRGDIAALTSTQRVQYYNTLCTNLGIDPLTQPFSIIKLQGKETLYANKNCTQQLSKIYKISHELIKTEKIEDVYAVTMRAKDVEGRYTDEIGAVTIGNLKGDNLANALMKASTKAKRRAVLAFCGLGILDETELETVRGLERLPEPIVFDIPPIPPEEQVITEEQGKALLALIKKTGWTKNDLKEMISYEFELADITQIKNKNLIRIKEFFSKEKPKNEI